MTANDLSSSSPSSSSDEGVKIETKKSKLTTTSTARNEASGTATYYDHSMLDDAPPTVPIQAPPAGNGEPIEIRLEDQDQTMSNNNDNTSFSTKDVHPQQRQRSTVSDSDSHVASSASSALYLTPKRALMQVTNLYTEARQVSLKLKSLASDEVLQRSNSSVQPPDSSSTQPSAQSMPSSSSPGLAPLDQSINDAVVQAQTSTSASGHPPLTEKDLLNALPHPNAIFSAVQMQWLVVLSSSELANDYEVPLLVPSQVTDQGPAPLWKKHEGLKFLSFKRDAKPILDLHLGGGKDAAPRIVEAFDQWQSTTGTIVFSTQAADLHSVVPKVLLDNFSTARLANPRPGSTGLTNFVLAAVTLTRIIANVANGKMQALTTSGKTISTTLGLDSHVNAILTLLGFTYGEVQGKSVLQPPEMTSKVSQLRIRRAFVELMLWLSSEVPRRHAENSFEAAQSCPRVTVSSDIPYHVDVHNCAPYLEHIFGFDMTQESIDYKANAPVPVTMAAEMIGANEGATDELLDYCYQLNTDSRKTEEKIQCFSALVELVERQRIESDVLQTRIGIEKSKGMYTVRDLGHAYKVVLGTELQSFEEMQDVDQTFLADVYRNAVREVASQPTKVQELKEAFAQLIHSRGNPAALNDLLNMPVELDIDDAYEILGVQHDTDDDFIQAAFQIAKTESRYTPEQCTEALRVIYLKRNSATLRRTYNEATGKETEENEWAVCDASLPAGLNNIGNTCYLNSVLQYFYAIQPLRQRVLEAGKSASYNSSLEKMQEAAETSRFAVGGRHVTQRELDRSRRFVSLLAQLFEAMMTSPVSAVTPERDLAYLALVSSRVEEQQEMSTADETGLRETEDDALAKNLASEPSTSTATETTLVDEPLSISPSNQRTATMAATHDGQPSASTPPDGTKPPPLPPRAGAVEADNGEVVIRRNSLMQLGAQQDVGECLDNVMFQVETALTAEKLKDENSTDKTDGRPAKAVDAAPDEDEWSSDTDLLRRLFLGRTNQRLEVGDVQKSSETSVHTKREIFKILPIEVVEEGRDIYDGLDGFFDEEILTDTGGQPIRRTVTLTDAPAIMQIQLQRVQFDRVRGAYKSQAHLSMGEKLFMDRYMDFDPLLLEDRERLEKRKQGREIRQRVAYLRRRIQQLRSDAGKMPISRSLDKTAQFLAALQKSESPLRQYDGQSDGENDGAKEARRPQYDGMALGGGGMPLGLLHDELNNFLQEESKKIDEEIKSSEDEIKKAKETVEDLWASECRIEYVLASVFMHRGEASHGHYFLNQRRLGPTEDEKFDEGQADGGQKPSIRAPKPAKWFKYNDNIVQNISLTDVLKDTTGATPYLLSYVRKDLQDSIGLFDTVCRHVDMGVGGTTGQANEAGPSQQQHEQQVSEVAGHDNTMRPESREKKGDDLASRTSDSSHQRDQISSLLPDDLRMSDTIKDSGDVMDTTA